MTDIGDAKLVRAGVIATWREALELAKKGDPDVLEGLILDAATNDKATRLELLPIVVELVRAIPGARRTWGRRFPPRVVRQIRLAFAELIAIDPDHPRRKPLTKIAARRALAQLLEVSTETIRDIVEARTKAYQAIPLPLELQPKARSRKSAPPARR